LPPDDTQPTIYDHGEPVDVVLPPHAVIEAGMHKFEELARLHWPSSEPGVGFKSSSFTITNGRQLRMTLGLVYMAMKEAEE
jgi:hypothetical protein